MNNYYYTRQKAPQRRFQNGRFENTHPYSNAVSSSVPCVPTRSNSQHELSQLEQRMSSIAHSMTNSIGGSQKHMHVQVIGSASLTRINPNHTWKGKCLKLIKNMLELEEAKPFREPLNGRKYPGYYLLVPKPIDLSEIVKRFRNGHYHAPHEFASDVRLMFDNLKKYFKNPESPIFIQTQKVSWWFESEYQRILGTISSNTPPPGHSTSSQASTASPSPISDTVTAKSTSQPRPTSSSLLQGGPNISICVSNNPNIVESSSSSQLMLTQPSRVVVLGSPLIATHSSSIASPASPIATSSLSETTLSSLTSTTPTVTPSDKNRRTSQTALHRSGSSSGSPRTPMSPNSSRPESESPSSPGVPREPTLEMNIEVSNIWFGRTRTKPQKPLQLSEGGFTMHLTKNGIVEPFHIHCEDIVKCMAHLGRNKKQTMFLFVLPNCMKRLEAFNPRLSSCSLIAIFATKLATVQISKLLHIFWVINKASLFAPVFSEIDQKGALLLLSNIRPEIMLKTNERIQHMIFGSTVATSDKKSLARSKGSVVVVRSNSSSSVDEVPSTSSPVTCTVTSAVTSAQQSCHVGSGVAIQTTAMTTTNSVVTSVASSGSSPMCLRTIPPCTNRTVSIGLPPMSVEAPTMQFGGNILAINQATRTRLAQSLPEDMQRIIRAKYSRLMSPSASCEPAVPVVGNVSEVSSAASTSYGGSSLMMTVPSVSGDSGTDAQSTRTSHPVQPPAMEEDEDDVDLEIIDELLIDSKDTVTHTPTGIPNSDDVMMTSESMSIRCPITQMIMKRPMKNRHCGHSYDFEGVQELIKQRTNKAKCPVLGCSNILPLRMEDMLRDEERWRLIQDKPT